MRKRKQLRLPDYDYSNAGAYHVTICAKDRTHLFGEISNGEMRVNEFGRIVHECWNDLLHHYVSIELDAFVVMPNRVHGILVIVDRVGSIHESPMDDPVGATFRRPNDGIMTTGNGAGRARPYRKPTLGQMIAYFKYHSAKRINELRGTPGAPVWQRNYFEHIIRNDKSLDRVRNYIVTNPLRWQHDKENVEMKRDDELETWLDAEGQKSLQQKPLTRAFQIEE